MRVIIHIQHSLETDTEDLTYYRDPSYYNLYPKQVEVSPFIQTFEGLDLRHPLTLKASCGLQEIYPNWQRWLSCGKNWCAWRKDANHGWFVVADGRRHGIPWPKGMPFPLPGRVWEPTGPWIPRKAEPPRDRNYHENGPTLTTQGVSILLRARRLGLPVNNDPWYYLHGFGTAPTVSWAYLESQRPNMLYWQTQDDLEQLEKYG